MDKVTHYLTIDKGRYVGIQKLIQSHKANILQHGVNFQQRFGHCKIPWCFGEALPCNYAQIQRDFMLMWKNITKVTDIRILRRLDLLLETPNLTIKFTPGAFNKLADFFSWKRASKEIHAIGPRRTQDIPNDLWRNAHHGHSGADKTWWHLKTVSDQYTLQDVIQKIGKCRQCQVFRGRIPSDPLGHLPDPSRPGEL